MIERLLSLGYFVIYGDAPSGVDQYVHEYFERHPNHGRWRREHAHWSLLGRGAGHERNERMIRDADMLVALFGDGSRSPGTSDALLQAVRKPIPAYVYHNGLWTFEWNNAWPSSATTYFDL